MNKFRADEVRGKLVAILLKVSYLSVTSLRQ